MRKNLWAYPIIAVLLVAALGCHKKEVAPPPPPPPPPVVEKKPEPVKVDSTEILARMRRERLDKAVSQIQSMIVYFDFDKSNIKPEFESTLNQIAEVLKANTEITVRIEGNCDERGTEAYNLALGERRATSAQEYLVSAGVPASRLMTKSWGEEQPVATCHDESCWSKNRRDEFKAEYSN